MKRTFQSCEGFTLIEVLVAITIFAIGLLALAGMQVTGIRGNSTAQVITGKVAYAQSVIEEFVALRGDEANDNINGQNNVLTTDQTYNAWRSADIDGAGTCTADVTVDFDPIIDGTAYTGLTEVVVTVSSNTGSDVTQTMMIRRF